MRCSRSGGTKISPPSPFLSNFLSTLPPIPTPSNPPRHASPHPTRSQHREKKRESRSKFRNKRGAKNKPRIKKKKKKRDETNPKKGWQERPQTCPFPLSRYRTPKKKPDKAPRSPPKVGKNGETEFAETGNRKTEL